MANKPVQSKVKCPFFLEAGKRGIRCESIFTPPRPGKRGEGEDEGELHPIRDAEARKRHLEFYCCDIYGHKRCPYFVALMCTKYPGEISG